MRGDKVALVGGNGAGKTTLLRLLLGELTPSEGSLRVSPMRVGHIAQTLNRMRADETLLQTAMGDSTPDVARARSVLGHLLLGGEWVGRAVATLSGGERLRLALAKLLYEGPDILFLDEPTSNLDMIGRERLEEALIAFRGTLVLVSHDRYLLDRVCTTVLHVASGSIRYVRAGYREVMDMANETRATRLTGTVRAVEEDGNALLLLRHRQAVLADILSRPMQETEKARVTTEFIALGCEIRRVEEKCRRR